MESYLLMLKKVRQALLSGCLFLMMGTLGVTLAYAEIGDRLEVAESKAVLYAGPSSTASRVMAVAGGDQMVEMERQGGWVFVALKSSGTQGWIRSSEVRKAIRKAAKPKPKPKAKIKAKVKQAAKAEVTLKRVPDVVAAVPETPFVTRKMSLEDMGLLKGVMFEGATVSHSRTFFFPAPVDSRITHGMFRLLFRASPNLHDLASVRLSVNDIPYKQVNLPADGAMHEMDVLLPSSVFRGDLVKVTIHSTMPVTESRCFDDRLNGIFLHILPESSLSISYQPVEKSIRDAWRLLPKQVTLSLSEGDLSKEQFASTLALMALLVDNGKEVKITRLPEIGDIIIAPKLAIEQLIEQQRLKDDAGTVIVDGMDNALDHVSNLSLVRFSNRSTIVVSDPYDVQPMYLLNDTWQMLGAGDRYRVFRPDNLNAHGELLGTEGESGYYSLPLSKLGLNTDAKQLSREVSWQTVINPFALPLGTEPDFLNINIVAPIRWDKDPTYELYVFLNDVLVKSARLENNGVKQQFTVNLPQEYQRQFNDIRIVVQHDIERGDCIGVLPNDYVQITPDSALVVKKISGDAPEKFSDLSRYFLSGFDTYMEASYLSHPEKALYLMARLAADFPLIIDHSRLHFLEAGEVLQPEGPFVAVGHFELGEHIEAPVRFDRGRVKIMTPNGDSYFDVNQLSRVTIAEIVKSPTSYGLWVSPSDASDLPIMERLELAEDDVAFIDSMGVIKTLDSSEPSLAQVYYPDVEDWFDVLGKYRFWLMVLLWFLLTMVVVYLYRMSRSNKMAREEDDAMYQTEEEQMQGAGAAHLREDHTVHPGDSLDHLDERR